MYYIERAWPLESVWACDCVSAASTLVCWAYMYLCHVAHCQCDVMGLFSRSHRRRSKPYCESTLTWTSRSRLRTVTVTSATTASRCDVVLKKLRDSDKNESAWRYLNDVIGKFGRLILLRCRYLYVDWHVYTYRTGWGSSFSIRLRSPWRQGRQ